MKRPIILTAITAVILLSGIVLAKNMQDTRKSDTAEKNFIEQMIPHHEGAVQMAAQANEQAIHDETKLLAARITTAQQKEITQMRQWYQQWWGKEVPTVQLDPHSGHGGEPAEGASNFDEGFVSMMIPHHESAVTMAREVLPVAKHPEIRKLAEDIISSQEAEIKEMKSYLNKWKAAAVPPAGSTITVKHSKQGFDKARLTIKAGTTVRFVTTRTDQPMYVASDPHPQHTKNPTFEQSYINGDFPAMGQGFTYTFTKPGQYPYHDHNDAGLTGIIIVEQ